MSNVKSMNELINQVRGNATNSMIESAFPELASLSGDTKIERASVLTKETLQAVETIKQLMTSHNPVMARTARENQSISGRVPLKINEAMMSNDATIVLKRVISDVLRLPTEGYYLSDVIARKTYIDGDVRSASFPALGSMVAGEIGEGQAYPEQGLSFIKNAIELKVKKFGLKLAISDELIKMSQWDLLGLMITQGGHALNRLKEQRILEAANNVGVTIYDNSNSNVTFQTTGLDVHGKPNGTLDSFDTMNLIAEVLSNGYNVTDLLVHPLGWVGFATDPRLLFQMLKSPSMGRTIPTPAIDPAQVEKNLPFGGIQVHLSPQLPFILNDSITLAGITYTGHSSSIMFLDRQSSIALLQLEDPHWDAYDHPDRDIRQLKMAERYDVGVLDQGRGIAVAQHIMTARNQAPVYTIRNTPTV